VARNESERCNGRPTTLSTSGRNDSHNGIGERMLARHMWRHHSSRESAIDRDTVYSSAPHLPTSRPALGQSGARELAKSPTLANTRPWQVDIVGSNKAFAPSLTLAVTIQ
jgi:hypothetical protein